MLPAGRAALPTIALAAVALATSATGCGATAHLQAGPRRPAAGGPVVEVVASAYPLAQLASYVGGKDVRVADLAGPGVAPRGLELTAAQRQEVARAAVVLDVGDGYQPEVETAPARRRLSLLPAVSRQARPYQFWLDPSLMARAATQVAAVLAQVAPSARAQFANGARDFQSVASSLQADFQSTFSQCNRNQLVTADDAFGRMAAAYGLVDIAVDRSPVAQVVALVKKDHVPVIFSEVGVTSARVGKVAAAAGVPVKSLDPLEVAPAEGARPQSYFDVMEKDLTAMESALACDISSGY